MVVGEKHYKHTDEGPVKNVRRNRSPPNASRGTTAEDGAGPSNNDDDDCAVREGPEYQAVIPEYNPSSQSLKDVPDSNYAIRMWVPTPKSLDTQVDLFVRIAREKHKYNEEQALGVLYWHGHNVDRALADLPNFAPTPNDWTFEDLVLFEQAFHFHGKNFQKIQQMLPDKNIGDLVTYYYLWKKIQYRVSLLDKRAKSAAGQCGNGGEKDIIEDSDSDFESIREPLKEDVSVEPARVLNRSKVEVHNRLRNKHKPPPGIYISHDDMKVLANSPHNMADALQKPLEAELESLKRRVIANKQEIATLKQRASVGIDLLRLPENQTPINSKWTHDELLLAVQGVRRYGKNFAAIAEVLGNKTEHHLQNFFYNFRVQYNLDGVVREYEAEHGRKEMENVDDGPADMEVDVPPSEMANPTSSSPPPPPLMKQFPGGGRHGSHHPTEIVHKPPVLHQAVKNTSLSGRMILHQPPPLFKHGTSLSSSAISAAK